MQTPTILTLIGGISQGSLNRKLYRALTALAEDEAEFIAFDISKLPYFSQDLELDPPDSVTFFKEAIREADAILFITPEYNHSIPGVLKNAIDWGSRPYGMNLWEKMPAGIMGASLTVAGTYGAQQHLRQILSYLNLNVMNKPEFSLGGGLEDEKSQLLLENFWQGFKHWINENGSHFQRLEDSP